MNTQAVIILTAMGAACICATLLIIAALTDDVRYLLAESALLHGAIIFIVLTAYEGNRRG